MGISHLITRFPELRRTLPVAPLGRFPTPIEEAPELASEIDVDSLWIKRDDLSGEAYGGNKVRKLELLYGQARRDRCTWVATAGAYGSHHVLATAIYGRLLGIQVKAVLCPQPLSPHVLENLLCTHGSGAAIRAVPTPSFVVPALAYEMLKPGTMLIPPGGSSALGTLSYAAAALELNAQIRQGLCPPPERIYVTLGSSGTHAGLVLGARLAGLECEIIGVRVTGLFLANEVTVSRLATHSARLLRHLAPQAPSLTFRRHQISVKHDQFGPGYGRSTELGEEAIVLARDTAALKLDTTYTGKTMAGLIADVRQRPPRGPVIYWNTLSSADMTSLLRHSSPQRLPPRLRSLYKGCRKSRCAPRAHRHGSPVSPHIP